MNNQKSFLGITIALLFCLVGFYTLKDYGLTWDTHFHLPRGEAYLHSFLTGDKAYHKDHLVASCQFQKENYRVISHSSLAGILSTIGCEIFYKKLRLLNPIDAHHTIVIILASITILAIYFFAAQAYNNWRIGFFAAIFLALFPRFWGHAHNNIKEIPQTAFIVLFFWAFWAGISRKRLGLVILSIFFCGLALTVQLTSFIIVPAIATWVLCLKWEKIRSAEIKLNITILAKVLLYSALLFTVLLSIWPHLWHDTISHLRILFFYYYYKTTTYRGTGESIIYPRYLYALGYAAITTPVVVIIMSIVGLKVSWQSMKRERDKVSLLILSWLFWVLLGTSLPGLYVYNGIRHFIFFVPALCIIAAIGVEHSDRWLQQCGSRYWAPAKARLAANSVMGLLILHLLTCVILTHPNQTSFFNLAIGGLWGAQKIGVPEATDYWANSYRNGVRWLNQHAENNSLLNVAFGEHLVAYGRELRPDIKLTSFEEIQANYTHQAGYIMFVTKRSWYNYRTDYCHQNLKPIHVIKVQGAPILEIYKYH